VSVISVFAPGKLFVMGEYAVLHGARALVAAMDAGIVCRAEPARRWRVVAPDVGVDFTLEDPPRDGAGALLASAAAAARDEFSPPSPLAFDLRANRAVSRTKHGLGGSAAAVVAVLGAVALSSGVDLHAKPTRARLFTAGLSVHRAHQRGRGSGADVAASVYGGWIDYALAEGGPRIAPAALPPGFRLAAVWSGVSSDTARAIEAFEAPVAVATLRTIGERFWNAVERGDRAAILRDVDAYGDALAGLAAGDGAGRIAELVSIARRRGFAAKGSGAVGGDCAIALGFDPVDFTALETEWRKANAEPLAVSLDRRGVREESPDA